LLEALELFSGARSLDFGDLIGALLASAFKLFKVWKALCVKVREADEQEF